MRTPVLGLAGGPDGWGEAPLAGSARRQTPDDARWPPASRQASLAGPPSTEPPWHTGRGGRPQPAGSSSAWGSGTPGGRGPGSRPCGPAGPGRTGVPPPAARTRWGIPCPSRRGETRIGSLRVLVERSRHSLRPVVAIGSGSGSGPGGAAATVEMAASVPPVSRAAIRRRRALDASARRWAHLAARGALAHQATRHPVAGPEYAQRPTRGEFTAGRK